MSPVQKLHRSLQSGQLKSELHTVSEAIHAARALHTQIVSADILKAKDFAVHIAYLTPDLSVLSTRPYVPGQEAAIQAELTKPGMCCIVVALTFGLRDWEKGNWLLGSRVLLRTALVERALQQWMQEAFITNT
jgi:hypothetical protein